MVHGNLVASGFYHGHGMEGIRGMEGRRQDTGEGGKEGA